MGWQSDWLYDLIFDEIERVWKRVLRDGRGQFVEPELIAQVGDGDLVEQMAFEDGDLVGAGEVTPRLSFGLLVHGGTSVQAMLTRTERSSRFD